MSDTPRTDAIDDMNEDWDVVFAATTNLCRELERENNLLRQISQISQQRFKELRADIQFMQEIIHGCGCDNHLQITCEKHSK